MFTFEIGYFFKGEQYIKLGDNGVATLVYVIGKADVFRYVSKGDRQLPGVVEMIQNPKEIAALANVVQKGI